MPTRGVRVGDNYYTYKGCLTMIVVAVLTVIAMWAGLIYVVAHFLRKLW